MERLTLSWSPLPIYHWLFSKCAAVPSKKEPVDEVGEALIFDRKTKRYRLRQDLFEKAIDDAADVMWSDRKVTDD